VAATRHQIDETDFIDFDEVRRFSPTRSFAQWPVATDGHNPIDVKLLLSGRVAAQGVAHIPVQMFTGWPDIQIGLSGSEAVADGPYILN
jgi:hypothetical protein